MKIEVINIRHVLPMKLVTLEEMVLTEFILISILMMMDYALVKMDNINKQCS